MSRKLKDGLKNLAWSLAIIVFYGSVIGKVILGGSMLDEPCMCPFCRTEYELSGAPLFIKLIERTTERPSIEPDIIELDKIIP